MTVHVSLEHLFTRTAKAFGVTPAQLRSRSSHANSNDARLAFCRLAVFAGASEIAVGMKCGRSVKWVSQAVWSAGSRLDADRAFAALYHEIEIECVAETGVAAATLYPLPKDADPRTIAERLVHSPREAMAVGTADLATIGAAFLALDDENTLLRAEIAGLRKPVSKDVAHGQAA